MDADMKRKEESWLVRRGALTGRCRAPPARVHLALRAAGALLGRDASPRRAGGGLALVLLEDVVAAHGGRVEIESSTGEHDHGTTVRLVLPIFLGTVWAAAVNFCDMPEENHRQPMEIRCP
jgi:hypothetical protein